ncbi:MAG: glycosyltransferase family 4 protein [Anaerolineae bacterium]|nr:glycosyltransferase family 4 protein [Anaerolineae bacterium]
MVITINEKRNRRILLHDRTGVPFTIQLGRELALRGHNVLYSYGAFFQSPKGNLAPQKTDPQNLQITPMYLSKPFQKYSFIRRRFQEMEYARDLVNQIKNYKPDVLIITGSHLDAMTVVYKECRRLKLKIIFWVQDIYGVAIKRILQKRLPIIGSLIGDYYIWQEKRLLRQSDEIILITEDFVDLMVKWGVESEKCHVIRNWTPLEELPLRERDNPWSRIHNLNDKFCFLYAGTLGLKHNPELLLQLALRFRTNPTVRVVVISEGLGADWLQRKRHEYQLENLVLLKFQPFEEMPNVLGAADALVGILEPDAGIYSAPSKVLTYLCAKRPLLLAIPPENLSAKIVSKSEAGLVVSPLEMEAFLAAANRLFEDAPLRKRLAANARTYAEKTFDIQSICDRFEAIIS